MLETLRLLVLNLYYFDDWSFDYTLGASVVIIMMMFYFTLVILVMIVDFRMLFLFF
jgi:hypothetical protein